MNWIHFIMTLPIRELLLSPLTAFIVCYVSIPSIVTVSNTKRLYDVPGERSSHATITPTLGGLAIFAGFSISMGIYGHSCLMSEFQFILASCIVIFFIGIKDDILIIAPVTKLGGQIIAALILVIIGDIRITNFHGFNGIFELNYFFSTCISIFGIIVIINAVNLIDGIDGLCSGVGSLIAITFGIWFMHVGESEYGLMAFTLVGSLIAFFMYNVYGTTNKIFMGDTGSMIIGLILAVMVIKFNELNIAKNTWYYVQSAPSVSFAILIVPLFDTLRVMFIRFFLQRKMFGADRNHIHHKLIALGLSHKKSTFIILIYNLFFILFAFYLSQYFSIRRLLLIIILLAMALSYIPSYIMEQRNRKLKQKE